MAVAIGSRSGDGVDERQRWQRGVETKGFFVVESELQSCLMFPFFFFLIFFLFILNLELRFIKRSSV